jgi:hypothetical protein
MSFDVSGKPGEAHLARKCHELHRVVFEREVRVWLRENFGDVLGVLSHHGFTSHAQPIARLPFGVVVYIDLGVLLNIEVELDEELRQLLGLLVSPRNSAMAPLLKSA